MNEHEIERVAAAANQLRPDWPIASLRTLIAKNLAERPRRDVAVALAWIACESNTATPARVLAPGPWWKAAAAEGGQGGHQHTAKVYGWTEGDPRTVCGICSLDEAACRYRAKTNGHEFVARVDCLPPIEGGAIGALRKELICGAEVIGGTTCRLRNGHTGDHEVAASKAASADRPNERTAR